MDRVMPEKHCGESQYNFLGDQGYLWKSCGEAYKDFKKDDSWFSEYLESGFAYPNGALPWSIIFSDIALSDAKQVIRIENEKYNRFHGQDSPAGRALKYYEESDWEEYPEADRMEERYERLVIKNAIEILCRSSAYCSVLREYSSRAYRDDDYKYFSSLNFVDIGHSDTRDYSKFGFACRRFLEELGYDVIKNENRDWVAPSPVPFEFMANNIKQYISWLVHISNEVQKVANYVRGHPSKEMIQVLYEHEWSDNVISHVANSPTGYVFYRSRTKQFDYWPMIERRSKKWGIAVCPV